MSKIRIKCEICSEALGVADTDTLRRPMRGHMFASPDPFHDFPAPFGPHTEWVDMRCKYGNHRPFLAEDAVMLESGEIFKVEYPDPPKPLEEFIGAAKDENGWVHLSGEVPLTGGKIPEGFRPTINPGVLSNPVGEQVQIAAREELERKYREAEGVMKEKAAEYVYGKWPKPGPVDVSNTGDSRLEVPNPPGATISTDTRWEPRTCEICGKVVKGAAAMGNHMRLHQ